MVNAIFDYVLLLDRLVIKWFIYVAEHDYYIYIWVIGPLLIGIIRLLLNVINNNRQSIQNEILKNYAKSKLLDKYDNINELVKVMNNSGFTYDEIREAIEEMEGEIEWLKV